jgi:tetratricopeptide (TPR) repeat protein
VRPDFELSKGNAADVAAICRRMDGLPLAIELAAARIRLLSPAALRERLDEGLHLLDDAPRDAPERQQSLRDAIAWSYGLLSRQEQQLFRRLAIFRGAGSLRAVEAICFEGGAPKTAGGESAGRTPTPRRVEDQDEVLAVLTSLVTQSLLRRHEGPGGEPRFSMLETIREFAAELLAASGETQVLRERHAVFLHSFATEGRPRLTEAPEPEWLSRLEIERENLRSALEWHAAQGQAAPGLRLALTLVPYWQARGHLAEAQGWLEALLAIPDLTEDRRTRADALKEARTLAYPRGDYAAARSFAEEEILLRRDLDDPVGMAWALRSVAIFAQMQLGDWTTHRERMTQALALFETAGARDGMAATLGSLGITAHAAGDAARARELWERFLTIQRERQDPIEIARAHERLARIAEHQGDFDAACAHLRERLAARRQLAREQGIFLPPPGRRMPGPGLADLGDVRALWEEDLAVGRVFVGAGGTAIALSLLSQITLDQGDFAAAEVYLAEFYEKTKREEERLHLTTVLGDRARLAAGRGDYGAAQRFIGEGLAVCREIGDLPKRRALLGIQGTIASAEADWERARPLLEEHAAYYQGRQEMERRALALNELGLFALRQEDPDRAREPLETALALVRATRGHTALARVIATVARLRRMQGRPEEARVLLVESLALRRRAGNRLGIAECLEGLAAVAATEHPPRAARLLGAATALRERLGAPLPPADRPEQEHCLSAIRAVVGEADFATAWASGQALDWREAAAEALADAE